MFWSVGTITLLSGSHETRFFCRWQS